MWPCCSVVTGCGFGKFKDSPFLFCSLCFVLIVQDVSSQLPVPATMPAMLPCHDRLLSLWNHCSVSSGSYNFLPRPIPVEFNYPPGYLHLYNLAKHKSVYIMAKPSKNKTKICLLAEV